MSQKNDIRLPGSYPENRCMVMEIIRALNPKSILDMGIGGGFYGKMIRRDFPDIKLEGVEIFTAYDNPNWENYDKVYHKDIRKMKFKEYDLYLMVDILEHFTKKQGLKLIKRLNKPILISTPWHFEQDEIDGNIYQKHLSQWELKDFKDYELSDYSNDLSLIILITGNKE